jgi:mannosyltransferase OCH1-like enzyme
MNKQLITKTVYQTWKTTQLPAAVEALRQKHIVENPSFSFVLYDDDDIEHYIESNFSSEVVQAFRKLRIGPAKADFFRYCVMYVDGGVYLDLDTALMKPLSNLLEEASPGGLISREANPGVFLQWMLVSPPKTNLMKTAIEICVFNIKRKATNDIFWLTGPGVFTTAVNLEVTQHLVHHIPYFLPDEVINAHLRLAMERPIRFLGVDFNGYAKFKDESARFLYEKQDHWQTLLRNRTPALLAI